MTQASRRDFLTGQAFSLRTSFCDRREVARRLVQPLLLTLAVLLLIGLFQSSWAAGGGSGGRVDTDRDGVQSSRDNCPGVYNPSQEDTDEDGVGDLCDNCIEVVNPGQVDSNHDGYGNFCDADLNDDGSIDDADFEEFSNVLNPPSGEPAYDADADLDSSGAVTTTDFILFSQNFSRGYPGPSGLGESNDGDGRVDLYEFDNCPSHDNASQGNLDGDAFGDSCDLDLDGDGVGVGVDNCLWVVNSDQANQDGDLFGDVCDLCPEDPQLISLDETLDESVATCSAEAVEFSSPSSDLDINPLDEIEIQFELSNDGPFSYAHLMVEVELPADLTSSPNPQRVLIALESGETRDFDRGEFLFTMLENASVGEELFYSIFLEDLDTGHGVAIERPFTLELFVDADGDAVSESIDMCPGVFNPSQIDSDGDGVGDACDNCSQAGNADQSDQDGDLYGDACDLDQDPSLDQNGPGAVFQEGNSPPRVGGPKELFDAGTNEIMTFLLPRATDFEDGNSDLSYAFESCSGPIDCVPSDMILLAGGGGLKPWKFKFYGPETPGDYLFTYRVWDTGGLPSASQRLTVHVGFDLTVFGLPRVEGDEIDVEEGSIYVGTFIVLDEGLGGLEFEITTPPFVGEVEIIDEETGTYRYQSRAGILYCDSFEFRATDQVGQESDVKQITICPTQGGAPIVRDASQQAFRICVWGDTQNYVYAQPYDEIGTWKANRKEAYQSQVDYILDYHCDAVLHMGDMVWYYQPSGSVTQELIDNDWAKTREVLGPIFDLGGSAFEVVFSPAQGNHDNPENYVTFVDELAASTSYFEAFSSSRTSHAIVANMGGIDQLIVSMACGLPEMSFLEEQINAHPGMPTIVHSHKLVRGSGDSPILVTSPSLAEPFTCLPSSPDPGYPVWTLEEKEQYFLDTTQIYLVAAGHYVQNGAGLHPDRDPDHPLLMVTEDNSLSKTAFGGDGWMMLVTVDPKTGLANVGHYTHNNKVWMGRGDDPTANDHFLNWENRGEAFRETTLNGEASPLHTRRSPETQGYYGSSSCNSLYLGAADFGGMNQCLHAAETGPTEQLKNQLTAIGSPAKYNGVRFTDRLPVGSSDQSVAEQPIQLYVENHSLDRESSEKTDSWLPEDSGFICLWVKPTQENQYDWLDSTDDAGNGIRLSAFFETWADDSADFELGGVSFESRQSLRRNDHYHLCLGWNRNEEGDLQLSATVNGEDACPLEGCPVSTGSAVSEDVLKFGQGIQISPVHELLVVEGAALTPERARWIIACGADDRADTEERVETYLGGELGTLLGPAGESSCASAGE